MNTRLLAAAVTFAVSAASLQAGTLHVPGDSGTIQGAINAAGAGDTILVAPGVYLEQIDFLGKRLVVAATGGATVTTIDAGGAGTAVRLNNAEPYGTALRGFTITGGIGQQLLVQSGPNLVTVAGGGGVFVGEGGFLELRDCIVTGNTVNAMAQQTLNYGGGVGAYRSTVTLVNCTLSNNAATRGTALGDVGSSGARLSLIACTISGNTASGTAASSAIYTSTTTGFRAANCFVTDNEGAGLSAVNGIPRISGCVFQGNTGWGLSAYGPVGVDLFDCSFLGNGEGGAALTGSTINTTHFVDRCAFANGDSLKADYDIELNGCSFDGANVDAPFAYVVNAVNCIVRNVPGGQFAPAAGSVTLTYSDVEGGAPGAGNFDADPLWVNAAGGDYHLSANSPCVDAGDPDSPHDANLSLPDMGAFPLDGWLALGGGISHSGSAYDMPRLVGQGALTAGQTIGLVLETVPPSKSTTLLAGLSQPGISYRGGILWPSLDLVIPNLVSDGTGHITLVSTWPAGVPSGTTLTIQYWFKSPTAVFGLAASNGVTAAVP